MKTKQKELLYREKEAFNMIKEIIKVNGKSKNYKFGFIRKQLNLLIHTLSNEKKEIENFKNRF